jgi:hypothetical protein
MASLRQSGFWASLTQYKAGFSVLQQSFAQIMLIVLFLLFWCLKVTGQLGFRAIFTCIFYVLLCMSYGRSLSLFVSIPAMERVRTVFQFLLGFFLFNSLLFVTNLFSPLGIFGNGIILLLLAVGLEYVFKARHLPVDEDKQANLVSLLCILLSGTGASIWCMDIQSSTVLDGQTQVIRSWVDTFYHVRHISAFEFAHGLKSISNVDMSGGVPKIYHYAIYFSAALVSAFSDISTLKVYDFFLLPFGILINGLSAFVLVSSLLGVWPALAATVAVILIPDVYQQGVGNKYLSYYLNPCLNLNKCT